MVVMAGKQYGGGADGGAKKKCGGGGGGISPKLSYDPPGNYIGKILAN